MYSRGFVACILAGFEEAIDSLISDVDERVRTELEELGARIADVRLRLDPETNHDDGTPTVVALDQIETRGS
ncbi:MAG: hypothetical protein LC130_27235 [Bryobacterales bacterium]|jgi:hypothetical protein|nr:hypothetical protein [Bryobacterales bacterium]